MWLQDHQVFICLTHRAIDRWLMVVRVSRSVTLSSVMLLMPQTCGGWGINSWTCCRSGDRYWHRSGCYVTGCCAGRDRVIVGARDARTATSPGGMVGE